MVEGKAISRRLHFGDAAARPGDTAESMLERARQNMQTVSNQKTDPTKSAEGAAPGSQTKVRHDRHRGGFRRSKLK